MARLTYKLSKFKRKQQLGAWKKNELAQYGMTLHGLREHGDFVWVANI
jgi:hypothetical protein